MSHPDDLLRTAEEVLSILTGHRLDALVIGALKLYAGGHKSKADIIELLARNPDLDLKEVRALCARYRLDGLEELIAEAGLV